MAFYYCNGPYREHVYSLQSTTAPTILFHLVLSLLSTISLSQLLCRWRNRGTKGWDGLHGSPQPVSPWVRIHAQVCLTLKPVCTLCTTQGMPLRSQRGCRGPSVGLRLSVDKWPQLPETIHLQPQEVQANPHKLLGLCWEPLLWGGHSHSASRQETADVVSFLSKS